MWGACNAYADAVAEAEGHHQSPGSVVIPAEDDCDRLGLALARHIVDKSVLGGDPA